jgi:glutamyl-tRNA synthetase
VYFYRRLEARPEATAQHYGPGVGEALDALRARLVAVEWTRATIGEAIKLTATERGWKMPRVAMPLRLVVTGETQTPAIDAVLELLGRDESLARMDAARAGIPD